MPFEGIRFTFTDLTNTKLDGANLTGAILANADLGSVRGHITQEQIKPVIGNSETKLPDYLNPPEAWTAENIEAQINKFEEQVSPGPFG